MQQKLYRDPKLSRRGLRVGISLSLLFNRNEFNKSGRLMAWPGEAWLAADTCMSLSSVKRAVQDLADRGHFEVVRGVGRTENRYVAALTKHSKRPKLRVIEGTKTDTSVVSTGELLNIEGNTDKEVVRGREDRGLDGFDNYEAYPGPANEMPRSEG